MESIPDSDSEGLGGGDQSITNITLAENGHQPDSRSLDEVSLLFSFPFVSLLMTLASNLPALSMAMGLVDRFK